MSDRMNQVIQLWKEFNLSQYQRNLDKTASEIADRQDASESSRKKLVELSKTFRKESSEDVRKAVADVLKNFQLEVDSLSQRSKAAEVAFLNVYKKLLDLPDPAPTFAQLPALQERAAKIVELETENERLKAKNKEYEAEFQDLRNQEVTVKQLRERVKSLETEMESSIQSHGEEARKRIEEEFEDREQSMKENLAVLSKRLSESERRVLQLQKALDASQSEVFEARTFDEVKSQAKSEEVDIILCDLEKATLRAVAAEKTCEELRAVIDEINRPGDEAAARDIHELGKTVKSLQIELSAKDKDLERLVEEIAKLKTFSESENDRLTTELQRALLDLQESKTALKDAQNLLEDREDYEDLKKEVQTFRSVEFGADYEAEGGKVPKKPLEVLLMEKNKRLQATLTSIKGKYAELTARAHEVEVENQRLGQLTKNQRDLVTKLEQDLANVQNVSLLCRGEGEGQPSSEWVLEAVSDLGTSPEPSRSSTSPYGMLDPGAAAENILPIISAQRERFRERNLELEARNSQLLEQMTLLQTELESLRGDNLKLYEKIRFLQSYSSSSSSSQSVVINTAAEDRWASQYEAKLDPFSSFSKKEQMRKYAGLSPYEKFTLSMGRAILSNKTARLMTLFYTFLLHGLVVLVLYKLAYTEDCKQEAAADCVKRFAEHMAQDIVYSRSIPGGLPSGRRIVIQGRTRLSTRKFGFRLTAGTGQVSDDVLLFLEIRFDERAIVKNSYIGGRWGQEERAHLASPFPDRRFTLTVVHEASGFQILLDGSPITDFRHRTDPNRVQHLIVDGDVNVDDVSFDSNHTSQYPGAPYSAGPTAPLYPSVPGAVPPVGFNTEPAGYPMPGGPGYPMGGPGYPTGAGPGYPMSSSPSE
ncbi:unnamed protein product [Notodromas monacha]|uniref:Protein CASP n=1 Tax=Notodromas monacha TaxID=399045 RepID=A0A7R9GGA0_9CRUS|nr:unnamed protein product [Notodromas monacha]CAG0921617.1 unnamed protein product [Notodromas monacha]